jgi:hypothetical protein
VRPQRSFGVTAISQHKSIQPIFAMLVDLAIDFFECKKYRYRETTCSYVLTYLNDMVQFLHETMWKGFALQPHDSSCNVILDHTSTLVLSLPTKRTTISYNSILGGKLLSWRLAMACLFRTYLGTTPTL